MLREKGAIVSQLLDQAVPGLPEQDRLVAAISDLPDDPSSRKHFGRDAD